ncbi:hypothetical protein TD95_001623 [Thielaviopsis punctulata]|uniref:Early meiotic induction protein 1 n=1 Tax=Thielaviopsis punctulata TaxID=72032 RepID=A0A0F4Z7Z8_9PEZI|nr:hypothetical protein TD95_001623 [Thielaviopsis punctulata]
MGWFWSSNSAPKPGPSAAHPSTSPPAAAASPSPSSSALPSSPPTAKSDDTDAEVQKFVDLFSSAATPSSSSSSSSSSSAPPQPSWLPAFITPSFGAFSSSSSAAAAATESDCPASLAPIAEAILPTEMSCKQAFDMAFSCNSLGGQWTAVYRNGEMRSCSELWSNFWFCMRHNGSSGPVTENLIRGHYRQREWEKYYAPGKKSSEDVWRSRDDRVPLDTAFKTPVPSFDDE